MIQKESSLFLMIRKLNVRLTFFFFDIIVFIRFSNGIDSVLYITRLRKRQFNVLLHGPGWHYFWENENDNNNTDFNYKQFFLLFIFLLLGLSFRLPWNGWKWKFRALEIAEWRSKEMLLVSCVTCVGIFVIITFEFKSKQRTWWLSYF